MTDQEPRGGLAAEGLGPDELAAARQRIQDLEEEVKILRRAAAAVSSNAPPPGPDSNARLYDIDVPYAGDCRR
jgi:hypothetical protein